MAKKKGGFLRFLVKLIVICIVVMVISYFMDEIEIFIDELLQSDNDNNTTQVTNIDEWRKEDTKNEGSTYEKENKTDDEKKENKNPLPEPKPEPKTEPEPEGNGPETFDEITIVQRHFKWDYQIGWKGRLDLILQEIEASVEEMVELEDAVEQDDYAYFGLTGTESNYSLAFWKNIYKHIHKKNYHRLNDAVDMFNWIKKEKNYNNIQIIQCMLNFIQEIEYKRPMSETYPGSELDIWTPPDMLDKQAGDCDTKSLLFIMLLKKMGYDALIYYSSYYGHAMTGIYLNASGDYKVVDGKKYYFCETTLPGWLIGQLPSQCPDERYWIPIKLNF